MTGIVAYILSKVYTNQAIQQAVIEGVKNYNLLEHKPKINDVVLQGNITLDELDVQPKWNYGL